MFTDLTVVGPTLEKGPSTSIQSVSSGTWTTVSNFWPGARVSLGPSHANWVCPEENLFCAILG